MKDLIIIFREKLLKLSLQTFEIMTTSFLSEKELLEMGFRKIGNDVNISRKASIYTPESIEIGNHVRIDDFCILSGEIKIASYIHISAYTALYGKFGIELDDFVTLSGRVLVYSQTDDYSGEFMTNPMVAGEFINVSGGKVNFHKHSIVGAGSIILPSVTLHEGACVGAMSLANKDIPEWTIYAGIPAKMIKKRNQKILDLEKEFKKKLNY